MANLFHQRNLWVVNCASFVARCVVLNDRQPAFVDYLLKESVSQWRQAQSQHPPTGSITPKLSDRKKVCGEKALRLRTGKTPNKQNQEAGIFKSITAYLSRRLSPPASPLTSKRWQSQSQLTHSQAIKTQKSVCVCVCMRWLMATNKQKVYWGGKTHFKYSWHDAERITMLFKLCQVEIQSVRQLKLSIYLTLI